MNLDIAKKTKTATLRGTEYTFDYIGPRHWCDFQEFAGDNTQTLYEYADTPKGAAFLAWRAMKAHHPTVTLDETLDLFESIFELRMLVESLAGVPADPTQGQGET